MISQRIRFGEPPLYLVEDEDFVREDKQPLRSGPGPLGLSGSYFFRPFYPLKKKSFLLSGPEGSIPTT